MAKGIIVVDMPERGCDDCEMMYLNQDRDKFCFINGFDELIEEDKPYWCPIMPMPEKIEYKSRQGLSQEQIASGWNACIDKIIKGD